LSFDRLVRQAGFPGSALIPAPHALRSLLALKLFGNARHSHVMSYVLDEGLALFAGLNVIPKRSFLTEYSCRIEPACYPDLLRRRSPALLRLVANTPASAWRRLELAGVSRQDKTPRILDHQVTLPDYDGPLRQLIVTDLGHEEPTILLTNQLRRSATTLIERY